MIALWGSRRSGKTTYLVALYYDILRRKKINDKWAMIGHSEAAQRLILDGYERFAVSEFPDITVPLDTLEPMKFEIKRPHEDAEKPPEHSSKQGGAILARLRGWYDRLMEGGASYRSLDLDFFDPSGELFRDPNRLMSDLPSAVACREFLANSAGMICIIDPDRGDGLHYFPVVYRNLINLSQLMNGGGGGGLPIPVAICVSKCDQYPAAYENPAAFLEEQMGPEAYAVLVDYCPKRAFFAMSAVGSNVEKIAEGQYRPTGRPQPKGVFEPIDWLMRQI